MTNETTSTATNNSTTVPPLYTAPPLSLDRAPTKEEFDEMAQLLFGHACRRYIAWAKERGDTNIPAHVLEGAKIPWPEPEEG